jgi:hypothetical protein
MMMRNKNTERSNMTEIIWTYDVKKAAERSKFVSTFYKECFESLSDKEMEDINNDDNEYLESLSNKERKASLELEKFRQENVGKWDKKREERLKKYDGGIIIFSKSLDIDNGIIDTKSTHTFTAVEKNGKIGIFLSDGFYEDNLFCDYLHNEDELDLFFDSIDIRSDHIDSDFRKTQFRRYAESVHIYFDIEEIINGNSVILSFSDGMWFSDNWKNEEHYVGWRLDSLASDRDIIIEEIKDYMEKNQIAKNCA